MSDRRIPFCSSVCPSRQSPSRDCRGYPQEALHVCDECSMRDPSRLDLSCGRHSGPEICITKPCRPERRPCSCSPVCEPPGTCSSPCHSPGNDDSWLCCRESDLRRMIGMLCEVFTGRQR